MRTSAAGRVRIEVYEGFRSHAYQDSGGVWTAGFGDTGPDVVAGLIITREEADRRLATRLRDEFEPGVMRAIGDAPTTQNQFDAMVSLAYNIGVGAFSVSRVRRKHVERDYPAAANGFVLWNQVKGVVLKGLVRRRGEEAALYLKPDSKIIAGLKDAVAHAAGDTTAVDHRVNPPERRAVSIDAAIRVLQGALGVKVDGDFGVRSQAALTAYRALRGR